MAVMLWALFIITRIRPWSTYRFSFSVRKSPIRLRPFKLIDISRLCTPTENISQNLFPFSPVFRYKVVGNPLAWWAGNNPRPILDPHCYGTSDTASDLISILLERHIMKPSIEQIKLYVYLHIAEIHTIKDLAGHFQTTDAALKMVWRRSRETLPLKKFIDRTRVNVAKSWYRRHPDALCKEVALHLGYHTYQVASRSFKRLTGQSMKRSLGGR
jgi:AraC-like DNA-binding protein